MSAVEPDIAAKLIERLLADPAFRDRFRRNPALACREAGLESLADEMRLGAGKAMQTLDVRESRSSLAGVMMAAAMEGMGVYEFSKHVVPHLEDLSGSLGDVLSRVNLPALPGGGALSGGPAASSVAAIAPPGEEEVAAADGSGSSGNGGNGAAAGAAAPAAPVAPEESQAKEKEKPPVAPELAAAKGKGAADDAGDGAAGKAGGKETGGKEAGDGAKADADALEAPSGPAEMPEGPIEPKASEGGPDANAKVAAEQGATPAAAQPAAAPAVAEQPAAAPAAAAQPPAPSGAVDPSTLGQDGTGGSANAEAQALLTNKSVVLDDVGVADIKAGKIDPRIVGVLTKLSQEHKIVVSSMCGDHPKMTTSGFVSNHALGRGLDIASIDGEIVSPSSPLAREVASALSDLEPSVRPDEIGSPFAINGPGYFTDAAHQNHIHVGFKQEIAPDFKLPAELAAGAQPAAVAQGVPAAPEVAAVAAAPGAAPAAAVPGAHLAVAAPPGDRRKASGLFAAVPAPAKAAAASLKAAEGGRDSQLFLQAVKRADQPGRTPDAVGAQPAAPASAIDLSGAPGAYPGDDAPKEQIAAWMAAEAKKRGLPPQLPVMAALVESNLTNVDFGDADSLGYFQMRVSIWDQGEYAGFAKDPDKQIDWFLDTAERVKEQRVARGQSIDDPSQFGEWIADVERPAEQFRGRYQLRLDEAKQLLANSPKAPPAAREVAPAPPAAAAAPEAAAAPAAAPGAGQSVEALTKSLLSNPDVDLPPGARSDLEQGVVDPRLVAIMAELATDHSIGLSVIKTGHDQFTSGGSVSNHFVGRGIDIATIDGAPVSPGNAGARELVSAITELEQSIRPTEVGSPWAIAAPGFFTDAAHQNHVHVAFDGEPSSDFTMPASTAAPAPAPAVASASPASTAPLADALPSDPKRASGLFAAIPQPAKAAAADLAAAQKPGADSGMFGAIGAEPAPQPGRTAAAPPAAPAVAAPAAVDLSGAPGAYPGDDAPKEQIAAWMAAEAKKRGLPPQLPVIAALVESNLTNVDFGDADSLGYFQMRVSIWERDYPGFAKDPDKQIDWFLDTAERVKAQRVARGQSIDDPSQFGEWIADVERPAEQYRGRYQLKLADANGLLANAPAAPPPAAPELAAIAPAASGGEPAAADAVADAAPPAVAQGPGPKALAALEEAKKHTGTPYKWGGSTPQTGFDCSGLVQWAYAQAGVKIPRVTDQQIAATDGGAVRRDELLPGDLVFFRDANGYVHHVGISMGGDSFLHSPRTGDVVKVSSLNEPYYKSQFTGGRRFDEPATAGPAAAPVAPAAAPVIDPVAVAAAQAAVARDAAEARQPSSGLFKAIAAQEARNHAPAGGDRAVASATPEAGAAGKRRGGSAMFLAAITPEQAAADAAAAAPPAPVAPAVPATPSVSAAPPAEAAAPDVAAPPAEAPIPAGPPPDLSDVPADYPGDDASQEALAKWLAREAEKAGLPPELPVMAALVESGVKNLNFGDADSVGFFQMRVGIWNRGKYAGYPDNPGLQIKWFIDTAVAHKKAQIAQGDADFGKDPRTWGEWIADVERPAEQYRGRYQLRLGEARRLLR